MGDPAVSGHFLNELLTTLTRRYAGLGRTLSRRQSLGAGAVLEQCDQLLANEGEVSNLAHARNALLDYQQLDHDGKRAFFQGLAERYAPDPEAITTAYEAFAANPGSATAQALSRAARSPRQELLRRLNAPPGHTFGLVRMRADLQAFLRDAPELEAVDADFMDLFRSWFNRGFLVMQRIDWHTPAMLLEKIIAYEAVHAIRSWEDLRQRVQPATRRCFGFFHPATGDEPLIFVQVALTRGLPDRVQPILEGTDGDPAEAEAADTATFFSISNCQTGLRGISFGNFLIKQVVEELRRELPGLKHFVTLSPMPGFADWLRQLPAAALEPLAPETRHALEALRQAGTAHPPDDAAVLRSALMPLAAHYLVNEKNASGQPLNPVSRFHLGNGAEVHRINWLADTSDNGLRQSHGLMVNYLYRLEDIERNHEAFATTGKMACSREVQKLIRQSRPVTPAY